LAIVVTIVNDFIVLLSTGFFQIEYKPAKENIPPSGFVI